MPPPTARIAARGEIAVVVGEGGAGGRPGHAATARDCGVTAGGADPLAAARAEVERLVAGGEARGAAARRVAAATGIQRRRLYGADPAR